MMYLWAVIPAVNIEEYDYTLPGERIARYPLSERDASKLLVYDRGRVSDRFFRELPGLLDPGLLMVFNDTRVVQARLRFRKTTGSEVEVFCLEPHEPAEYNQAFRQRGSAVWNCLVGNAKKWKAGTLSSGFTAPGGPATLEAEKIDRLKDAFLIRFRWNPAELSFAEILESAGSTPIPPYLERRAEDSDRKSYQTVYSRIDGSVAAPTAGLHFTREVMQEIAGKDIQQACITLHVGAGTFQPVGSGGLEKHPMHAERFSVPAQVIEKLAMHEGEIFSVGTTTTRVLESLYWLGCRLRSEGRASVTNGVCGEELYLDQWDAYRLETCSRMESMSALIDYLESEGSEYVETVTRLMIIPGYRYSMTDRMITNFHMPRSTLLLLVGAFIGDDWKQVYRYALENGFRFLSYGDSSLLVPGKP